MSRKRSPLRGWLPSLQTGMALLALCAVGFVWYCTSRSSMTWQAITDIEGGPGSEALEAHSPGADRQAVRPPPQQERQHQQHEGAESAEGAEAPGAAEEEGDDPEAADGDGRAEADAAGAEGAEADEDSDADSADEQPASEEPAAAKYKIFTFWHYPNGADPLVSLNLESWRKNAPPGTEIVLVNHSNIKQLVPDCPEEFFRLPYPACKSDFVRSSVLYHHGGLYMDADFLVMKSLDSVFQKLDEGWDIVAYSDAGARAASARRETSSPPIS